MRMQVILDSILDFLFARPVQPLYGAGRKESSGTGLLLALKGVCGMTIAHRNTLSKILKGRGEVEILIVASLYGNWENIHPPPVYFASNRSDA